MYASILAESPPLQFLSVIVKAIVEEAYLYCWFFYMIKIILGCFLCMRIIYTYIYHIQMTLKMLF